MEHIGRSPGLVCLLLLGLAGCASAPAPSPQPAIVTSHPLATQAALRTLDLGGNAYDAAITAATVLGVVEPFDSGLGGGGLWLVQRPGQEPVLLDGREMAPGAAGQSDFPITGVKAGVRAAAVPGQPAALAYLSQHYAERPLRDNLAAAIQLARQGHAVDADFDALIAQLAEGANPEFRRIFVPDQAAAATRRRLITQPELARTLEHLADEGFGDFYQGDIGRALLADVQAEGGQWTRPDLLAYSVEPGTALQIPFGEARITTAPAPSVSGLALAQTLGILQVSPLEEAGADAEDRTHHLAEAMRQAYPDAIRYGVDLQYRPQPLAPLLSPQRLQRQAAAIDPLRAGTSPGVGPLDGLQSAATGSYIAVIDSEGNRVSAALSIGRPFGARVVSASTGVLLNDAMNDFRPAENSDRATGASAGERPATTLAPVILDSPGRSVLLGAAGAGPATAAMLLTGILESLGGGDAASITSARRFGLTPAGDLAIEQGRHTPQEIFGLEALGHRVRVVDPFGQMHAIVIEKKGPAASQSAASDPRDNGQAIIRQMD